MGSFSISGHYVEFKIVMKFSVIWVIWFKWRYASERFIFSLQHAQRLYLKVNLIVPIYFFGFLFPRYKSNCHPLYFTVLFRGEPCDVLHLEFSFWKLVSARTFACLVFSHNKISVNPVYCHL